MRAVSKHDSAMTAFRRKDVIVGKYELPEVLHIPKRGMSCRLWRLLAVAWMQFFNRIKRCLRFSGHNCKKTGQAQSVGTSIRFRVVVD